MCWISNRFSKPSWVRINQKWGDISKTRFFSSYKVVLLNFLEKTLELVLQLLGFDQEIPKITPQFATSVGQVPRVRSNPRCHHRTSHPWRRRRHRPVWRRRCGVIPWLVSGQQLRVIVSQLSVDCYMYTYNGKSAFSIRNIYNQMDSNGGLFHCHVNFHAWRIIPLRK